MKLKVFVKQRTSRLSEEEATDRVRKILPGIHLFLLQFFYCILYFSAQSLPSYFCRGSPSFTLKFIASFSFIVITYMQTHTQACKRAHTHTQAHKYKCKHSRLSPVSP